MPAIQSFYYLLEINHHLFSKEEKLMLEAELFIRICAELKEMFRQQLRNYFQLMNVTIAMEDVMLDENFIRLIINEILLTEEYTLEGIAYYTGTPEDVIHEVIVGINKNPSATFLRRVIELHRSVKQEVYQKILKKIASEYLAVA